MIHKARRIFCTQNHGWHECRIETMEIDLTGALDCGFYFISPLHGVTVIHMQDADLTKYRSLEYEYRMIGKINKDILI